MLETLFQNVASPNGIAQLVLMLLALFARDVVVGGLRAFSKRVHSDKDPKNDAIGDAADVVANAIDKLPGGPKK